MSHYLPSKSALAPKQQQHNNNVNFIHNSMVPTDTRPRRSLLSVIQEHRVEGGSRRKTSDRKSSFFDARLKRTGWKGPLLTLFVCGGDKPVRCVEEEGPQWVCVCECVCKCVCVCAHVDEERVGLLREQECAQLPLSPLLVNSVGGLPLQLLPLRSHLVSPLFSDSSASYPAAGSPGTFNA